LSIAVVTVTERELKSKISDIVELKKVNESGIWGESDWGQFNWRGAIAETLVLGESPLGQSVLGGKSRRDALEEILQVLSNGGFPRAGLRESLTEGERHQL